MPPGRDLPSVGGMSITRFLRRLLQVVAGLVGLVLLLYVVGNGAGMVAGAAHRDRLADELTDRLVDGVPTARAYVDRAASAAAPPDHAWLEQRCGFATDEGGWIVLEYREVCGLDAVVVWQVSGEAEARRLARAVPGVRPAEPGPADRCPVVATGPNVSVTYLPPGRDTSDDLSCRVWESRLALRTSRSVEGEPSSLDPTVGWLVLEREQPLVDESLGCVHWSVLFCDNPFGDELAWGEPPG